MIPGGWTRRTLGELVDIKHGYAFDSRYFNTDGNGMKLLSPGNFSEEGGFKDTGVKQKFFDGPIPEGYLLEKDDLLVAMTEQAPGLLGSPVLVPESRKFLHNQRLGLIQSRDAAVLPGFLFHVFNMPAIRREISATAGGTKVRHSSPDKIRAVSWIFPPVSEQVLIAKMLSTFSEAVTCTKQLGTCKQRFSIRMRSAILGEKRRFRGFVEQQPRRRLGDFLSESRFAGTDGSTARKLTVKLYGRGVVPKAEKMAGSAATQYFARKSGQFIYSKLDFLNGAFGVVPESLDGFETTADLPAFDVEAGLNAKWLLAYVTRETFYRPKVGLAAGGRKARRVNPSSFLDLKIPIPSRDEQDKIVAFLDSLDSEIDLISRQADALARQKKGLMEKLLTGKIRVKG